MKNMLLIAVLMSMSMSAFASGEDTGSEEMIPCESNADCPEGSSCMLLDCGSSEDGGDEMDCPDGGYCAEDIGPVESECTSDGDCPDGYYCEILPCPIAMGPDGEETYECAEEGYCVQNGVFAPPTLVAAECTDDADCPMGFACEEYEIPCSDVKPLTECVCEPCDPDSGEECPECECPEEPVWEECEEQTALMCVYSFAECTADADCDDGFECLAVESCTGGSFCECSSCACAGCPEGEEDCPPCDCPEEEVCECYEEEIVCETEVAYCVPVQQECASDDECPEGWECSEFSANATSCACADCLCEETACDPDDEECEEIPCECEPCVCEDESEETVEAYCLPGGWNEAIPMGGEGGGTGSATSFEERIEDAVVGDQEGVELDFDKAEDATDEENAVPSSEPSKSGCTMGTTGSSGSWMTGLIVIALGLLLRRRRFVN